MRHTSRRIGFSLALFIAGAALAATDEPQSWLDRMNHALATRNYQALFMHQHGGQSETLRITHRVTGSDVAERIVSLDGSGREFIRHGSQLYCYLPDQHLVLVEQSPPEGLLLSGLRDPDVSASGQYTLRELDEERISGRTARIIALEPRDAFRYGYRLWIDEASAMPLKTQLMTADGHVVEQIVFAQLSLPDHIADAALEPQVDVRGFRWLRRGSVTVTATIEASGAALGWDARTLPPGFQLTARSVRLMPGQKAPVTQLVFSDGLASVSVFVEDDGSQPAAATAAGGEPEMQVSTVGSASTVSTVIEGHRVTAIGEAPADTVRAIAGSVVSSAAERSTIPPWTAGRSH
ncbi:MAG: MucB/RseB C-terminal domain-containing protein [Steroidobacteraceae bacterium]|jgi:sigma-E factor negative regulatory protein RseB